MWVWIADELVGSDASLETAMVAMDKGARMITHLFK